MGDRRLTPRIAPYHCGPYLLGAILQDPGTVFGSGCKAQETGQIGVLNGDPTADLCKHALEVNGIPLSAYLPMNAIPWYDAPRQRSAALLREGALHNRALILHSGIRLLLLLGTDARRSEGFLDLPAEIEVRCLPHPGRLGLMNYRQNGVRLGAKAARRMLIAGFSLPRPPHVAHQHA